MATVIVKLNKKWRERELIPYLALTREAKMEIAYPNLSVHKVITYIDP